MSDDNNNPSTPAIPTRDRRASFSPGQPFVSLFGRSPTKATGTSAFPGPIATAAANAQNGRRRMSISTLGLSGSSPTQTSPFASAASRRDSLSSAGTGSATVDESAIEEGDAPATAPTSPIAQRMSFGARALRDVRGGAGSGNNTTEGFNWSDSLRSRAQRASTISVMPPNNASAVAAAAPTMENSTASVKRVPTPPRNAPKPPPVPDHFQERMLKGDFYMD